MRWFRTHIGLGSRLALFALAVQLVLSFGHVHVGKIAPASSHGAITVAQSPDRDGGPSPKPHNGVDDFCAICATVSLLASSVLPTASSPLPPAVAEHRWLIDFASARISSDSFVLFQARAPPVI
jgi:hypothetical protein